MAIIEGYCNATVKSSGRMKERERERANIILFFDSLYPLVKFLRAHSTKCILSKQLMCDIFI